MATGAAIALICLIIGFCMGRYPAKAQAAETPLEAAGHAVAAIVKRKAYGVGGKRAPKFLDDAKAWQAERER
jgi:hypothetical protein